MFHLLGIVIFSFLLGIGLHAQAWVPMNGHVHFEKRSSADSAVFLRSYQGTALQQSTLVGLSSESRLKNVTANMTGIVLKEAMVVPQTGGVHGGVGISFPIDTDWGEPAAPPAFTMRGDLLQHVNTRNVTFSWETSAADVGVVSQLLLQRATSNQWIVLSEPILPTQNTVTIETSGGEFVLRRLFQDGGFLDSDGEAYSGVVGQSKYWQRILVDTVSPAIPTAQMGFGIGVEVGVDDSGECEDGVNIGLFSGADIQFLFLFL